MASSAWGGQRGLLEGCWAIAESWRVHWGLAFQSGEGMSNMAPLEPAYKPGFWSSGIWGISTMLEEKLDTAVKES